MENDVVWQSTLTEEMVANLSENDLSMLLETLDDAVAEICENYGVTD